MSAAEFVLRLYQRETVDFLVEHGRAINADEMGLGKTVSTLTAARALTPPGTDALIVCRASGVGVWEYHIQALLGEDCLRYQGSPTQRRALSIEGAGWVVASYGMLRELVTRRRHWPLVIFDEAHTLRNHVKTRTSKRTKRSYPTLFGAACQLQSDQLFLLTGTPYVNHPIEIWPLLHLVDRARYGSYWRFAEHYFCVDNDWLGHPQIGDPTAPRLLRTEVQRSLIRHTKKQVGDQLPPKLRRALPLEMTRYQRGLYRQAAKEMLVELEDAPPLLIPSQLAKGMRLRQILVTPALIGGRHESAAFDLLRDRLEADFDVGLTPAIFTPFAAAIPYLEELGQRLGAQVTSVYGRHTASQVTAQIARFQAAGPVGARRLLLGTIQKAISYTATRASRAYFLGCEWAPAVNYQAEDRLHREGQRVPVEVHYLVHKGTYEEHVIAVLEGKNRWSALCFDPEKLLLPRN